MGGRNLHLAWRATTGVEIWARDERKEVERCMTVYDKMLLLAIAARQYDPPFPGEMNVDPKDAKAVKAKAINDALQSVDEKMLLCYGDAETLAKCTCYGPTQIKRCKAFLKNAGLITWKMSDIGIDTRQLPKIVKKAFTSVWRLNRAKLYEYWAKAHEKNGDGNGELADERTCCNPALVPGDQSELAPGTKTNWPQGPTKSIKEKRTSKESSSSTAAATVENNETGGRDEQLVERFWAYLVATANLTTEQQKWIRKDYLKGALKGQYPAIVKARTNEVYESNSDLLAGNEKGKTEMFGKILCKKLNLEKTPLTEEEKALLASPAPGDIEALFSPPERVDASCDEELAESDEFQNALGDVFSHYALLNRISERVVKSQEKVIARMKSALRPFRDTATKIKMLQAGMAKCPFDDPDWEKWLMEFEKTIAAIKDAEVKHA